MFILTDTSLGKAFCDINHIIITYYNEKTDILDIFDNNFPINENIIPIITSILEKAPKIYTFKKYNCIDADIIIKPKKQITNSQNTYPSFYIDVDILENDKLDYSRIQLINTLIDNEDKQLIRMFSKKQITTIENDFTQNILTENVYKTISWEYDWGSVDILINIATKLCNYQICINIIENKKIIHSRLTSINDTLCKLNKIKCEFIIN